MNEIYVHALKLLRVRDYTVTEMAGKLRSRFGEAPQEVIDQLVRNKFLNDRRFAERFAARRRGRGILLVREELAARGVPAALAEEILSTMDWPSLNSALTAKMNALKLRAPLQPRDAARLFRALLRLGYDEDAIREEIEQLNEQQ